jgi:hypothetical protein
MRNCTERETRDQDIRDTHDIHDKDLGPCPERLECPVCPGPVSLAFCGENCSFVF